MNNYNDNTTNTNENCSAASNSNNCSNDINIGNNKENVERYMHQTPIFKPIRYIFNKIW